MAHITFNPELLSALKDKVVVLTGGATGIGREAVKLFHGSLLPPSLSPSPQESPPFLSTTIQNSPSNTPNRSRSKNPLRRHQRPPWAIPRKRTLFPINLQIPTLRHNILHFPTISLQNRLFPLWPNRHRNRQCRHFNPTRSILPFFRYQ